MDKITFSNKVDTKVTSVAEINKVTGANLNEIKNVANLTVDQVTLNTSRSTTNTANIASNKEDIDSLINGNGKTYTSISDAMAVSPLPADNVPFTIRDSVDNAEDGFYIYLSTEGVGYKFLENLQELSSTYYIVDSLSKFNTLILNGTSGIWIVINNITLDANKTIPLGVILQFRNAKISLGGFDLTATNTEIQHGLSQIFDVNGSLLGTWNVEGFNLEWFGIISNDSTKGVANALISSVLNDKKLIASADLYYFSSNDTDIFRFEVDNVGITGGERTIFNFNAPSISVAMRIIYFDKVGNYVKNIYILNENNIADDTGDSQIIGVNAYRGAYDYLVENVKVEIRGGYDLRPNDTANRNAGSAFSTFDTGLTAKSTTYTNNSIASGSDVVVTPNSMVGINEGMQLFVGDWNNGTGLFGVSPSGGNDEIVIVKTYTDTTFTADFVNNHSALDKIHISGYGIQNGIFNNCYALNGARLQGFLIYSNGNNFNSCKAINMGNDGFQHGAYVQGGQNIFTSCFFSKNAGASWNFRGASLIKDNGGNKLIGCTSEDANGMHLNFTNVDINNSAMFADETPSNRYNNVIGCTFRNTKGYFKRENDGFAQIITNTVKVKFDNNIFEDLSVEQQWVSIDNQNVDFTNNTFVITNITDSDLINTSTELMVFHDGEGIISNNQVIGRWGGRVASFRGDYKISKLISKDSYEGIKTSNSSVTGINQVKLDNCHIVSDERSLVEFNKNQRFTKNHFETTVGSYITNSLQVNLEATIFEDNDFYGEFRVGNITDLSIEKPLIRNNRIKYYASNQQLNRNSGAQEIFAPLESIAQCKGVKLDSSGSITTCLTTDVSILGVTANAPALSQVAFISTTIGAEIFIEMDAAWTIGNYAILSTTVAGEFEDNGSTIPSVGAVFLLKDTGASSGIAKAELLRKI